MDYKRNMRLDRLLSITVLLINRGRIQARELARQFDVSVRTIYRDIEAINLAGIPVISYPGTNGGFGIAENYKIERQVLSLPDLLAIFSALKGINATLENRELDAALDKLHSLIPVAEKPQLDQFSERFVVDILPWGNGERQKKLLKQLHYAITREELVRLTYGNSRGELLTRTIEPMTLIFKGYTWYLFAYCRLRSAFRLFRLSRIKDLKISGRGFTRRGESYTAYLNFQQHTLPIVHLKLKFSPRSRFRLADYFDPAQIQIQSDGSFLVEVSYPEDEWVYESLLGYGEMVEVLSPPHIRRIIREKAEKICKLYQT